jgi:hypothetical protein
MSEVLVAFPDRLREDQLLYFDDATRERVRKSLRRAELA